MSVSYGAVAINFVLPTLRVVKLHLRMLKMECDGQPPNHTFRQAVYRTKLQFEDFMLISLTLSVA